MIGQTAPIRPEALAIDAAGLGQAPPFEAGPGAEVRISRALRWAVRSASADDLTAHIHTHVLGLGCVHSWAPARPGPNPRAYRCRKCGRRVHTGTMASAPNPWASGAVYAGILVARYRLGVYHNGAEWVAEAGGAEITAPEMPLAVARLLVMLERIGALPEADETIPLRII